MKFTVALPELQRALQKLLPAIPAKSTIPVLEHMHVALAGSELTFTATDQEITISLAIPVAGEADGEVLIPARQFNDLSRNWVRPAPSKLLPVPTSSSPCARQQARSR